MELHGRCGNNPNTSVGTGGSSPHPKMYSLKSGIFKFISSVTCNVESAVWQPWKLSPLFLHRTGIARAAAMQASPHCPANVPQPSSEEVTSGGEWVEESLSVQRLLQWFLQDRLLDGGWPLVLSEPPVFKIISLCITKRHGLDSLRLHYSAWLLSHFDISLWLDGTCWMAPVYFFLFALFCC